jgi:Ca2+/H+ antiporter, TMEM165/GDT1 family
MAKIIHARWAVKNKTMKKFWLRKKIMMASLFLAVFLAFTAVVMWLWNVTLPEITGVRPISYLQAMGILVLSKILFGGFGGRRGGPGQWKEKMKEKMAAMTPEERAKFSAEWRNRCGNRWKMRGEANTPNTQDKEQL